MILWYKLDRNKKPIPVEYPVQDPRYLEYMKWLDKTRVVKKTPIGGMEVSTVFLGLDHGFNSEKPVLWETMIFGEGRGEDWEFQWRYTSHEEAIQGHNDVVRKLEAKLQKQLEARGHS